MAKKLTNATRVRKKTLADVIVRDGQIQLCSICQKLPAIKTGSRSELLCHKCALPHVQQLRATPKLGRNELCPCGSKKKFKKCCRNLPTNPLS